MIDFALETYGLTHIGPITIHISHSASGLFTRYEETFGEELEELPSECSFQEGEHMFFGPQCRSDRLALAWEWFVRAVGGGDVSPVWVGHGAFDYFASHYAEGEVPEITEDRFRRALFYERGRDIRLDRASGDLMTIVMLYTIEEHGDFGDWLRFYGSTAAGLDVETSFEGVFEVPLAEFYETFEEWTDQQKLILTSIAFRSCREASEHIRLRSGSVGIGPGLPRLPRAAGAGRGRRRHRVRGLHAGHRRVGVEESDRLPLTCARVSFVRYEESRYRGAHRHHRHRGSAERLRRQPDGREDRRGRDAVLGEYGVLLGIREHRSSKGRRSGSRTTSAWS